MLQDWEQGLVGNNPGIVSRLAERPALGRVVINALRGRARRVRVLAELPSAA